LNGLSFKNDLMKPTLKTNFLAVLFLIALCLSKTIFAQAPENMSYQTVIRDNANKLVVSKPVGLRLSILQGSATGTVVHTETQSENTNANGLISTVVGTSNLNWSTGPYFLKTEVDPTGGTNYTIMGIAQLLSVPYALYAENSGNGETPGNAVGDLKYWDGSSWVMLPIGTPNQVLKVSPSKIPQWQAEVPQGGKTYIVIQGNITDAQAATQLSNEYGASTQFVWIQNTTALTALDLSVLSQLIDLKVFNNTALTSITLNGLTNITNNIEITQNPKLASLTLPALATVSNMDCSGNLVLAAITLPALSAIFNDFQCRENVFLTSLSLPVLASAGQFNIQYTAITSLSLPALTSSATFYLSDNAAFSSILLPVLKTINVFSCNRCEPLTSLSLPALITAGEFQCYQNGSLTSLSLPLLVSCGSFSFHYNAVLTSLQIPSMTTNDNFYCNDNLSLTALVLPALASSVSINVIGNGALTSLSLPALVSSGSMDVWDNGALNSINISSLSTFSGNSFDASMNALPSSQINALLAKFVSLGVTPLTHIKLWGQTPAAPPTGSGITDKAILIAAGKSVETD
jgi:hypothetical protein